MREKESESTRKTQCSYGFQALILRTPLGLVMVNFRRDLSA